jgi:hypothetical protein
VVIDGGWVEEIKIWKEIRSGIINIRKGSK